MAVLYSNFIGGVTTDSPLTLAATSFNSAALANVPAVASPNIVRIVLDPEAVNGAPEIVYVTAHTSAATSATVARAQEFSSAREHPAGTAWVIAATAADFAAGLLGKSGVQKGDLLVATSPYTTARQAVGSNGQVLTADSGQATGVKWSTVATPTAGDIKASIASSISGWLLLDGSTINNADSTYPSLWAVAPASWKSGSALMLPDMSNRVLEGGGTLGATSGSMSHTLTEANLPAHDHSIDHDHPSATTSTAAAHTHTINHDHASFNSASDGAHDHTGKFLNVHNPGSGGAYGAFVTSTSTFSGTGDLLAGLADDGAHQHAINVPAYSGSSGSGGSHSHTLDVAAYVGDSGSTGSGEAVDHSPAALRVNFFIKT